MSLTPAAAPKAAGVLWSEGYRPFFLFFPTWGAVFLLAWGRALAGGPSIPVADHAAVMLWGVLGSGVMGFLLTAYPRQNGASPPSPRALYALMAGHVATHAALASSWMGARTSGLATLLGACVWASMLAWSLRVAVPSLKRQWEWTAATVPAAMAAALVGWVGVRTGVPGAVDFGLHGFLLLLALSLLDKMLPFFSSRAVPGWEGVRRPWFIPLLAAGLLVRTLLAPAGDLLIVALLLRQWWGWQPHRGFRVPLVGVLHLGVLWMVVGYAADALGAPRTACIHLWGIGGLCTLILGFAARVSLGHGGRALVLDRTGMLPLALVQVALALRLAVYFGAPTLIPSGWLLSAAFVAWGLRFGPLLFAR